MKQNQIQEPILSPKIKPKNMSLVEWQLALRRRFGADNLFEVKNIGNREVFSDFEVINPINNNKYKVAIRSQDNSLNFCTCNDFKTNGLSTCKHIEYVLHKIKNYPPYYKILLEGYLPSYSSIYLKYSAIPEVMIKIGTVERGQFEALAKKYFNHDLTLKEQSIEHFHELANEAKAIDQNFKLYDDALEFVLQKRAKVQRQHLLQQAFGQSIGDDYLQNVVKSKLYEHQKRAVFQMLKQGNNLIIDEGLFDFWLQLLTASEIFANKLDVKKILVLLPQSQVANCIKTIENQLFHADYTFNNINLSDANHRYHIIDFKSILKLKKQLSGQNYDVVIVSHAHQLPVLYTSEFELIKKIKTNYRLVHTCFPLDTKAELLYSVSQLVDIFAFGPKYVFFDKHIVYDAHGTIMGYKNLHDIMLPLKDYLVKKTFNNLKNTLPQIQYVNSYTLASTEQYEMYEKYRKYAVGRIQQTANNSLSEADRSKIWHYIHQLRNLANDASLVEQMPVSAVKLLELFKIVKAIRLPCPQPIAVVAYNQQMLELIYSFLVKMDIETDMIQPNMPSPIFRNENNNNPAKVYLINKNILKATDLLGLQYIINIDVPIPDKLLMKNILPLLPANEKYTIISMFLPNSVEYRLNVLQDVRLTEIIMGQNHEFTFSADTSFADLKEQLLSILSPLDDRYILPHTGIKYPDYRPSQANHQLDIWGNADPASGNVELLNTKVTLKKKSQKNERTKSDKGISQYLFKEHNAWFLKIPIKNEKAIDKLLGFIHDLNEE